jgi:hypothetical protein
MQKRLLLALIVGAAMAPLSASAQIYNYWGVGTIRAGTTTGSSTSVSTETSNSVQQVYGGSTYSATGENIQPGGALGPGQTYTVARPGEPFQFSETYQPAGLVSITNSTRTVDTNTLTNSLSVFSEVGTN